MIGRQHVAFWMAFHGALLLADTAIPLPMALVTNATSGGRLAAAARALEVERSAPWLKHMPRPGGDLGDAPTDAALAKRTSKPSAHASDALLITGCGKSGTHAVAALLQSNGVRAKHEKNENLKGACTTVAWMYGVNGGRGLWNSLAADAKAQTRAIKRGEQSAADERAKSDPDAARTVGIVLQPDAPLGARWVPIIHVVRRPLDAISSMAR